jgi:hypothetical protein
MTRSLTAIGLSTVGAALIVVALPAVYFTSRQIAENESAHSQSPPASSADAASVRVILASPYAQDGVVDSSKLRPSREPRGDSDNSAASKAVARARRDHTPRLGADEPDKQARSSPQIAEQGKQAGAADQRPDAAEQLALRQPPEPQRLSAGDANEERQAAKQPSSTEQRTPEEPSPSVDRTKVSAGMPSQEAAARQDVGPHTTGAIEAEKEFGQSRARRAAASSMTRSRARSTREFATREFAAVERRRHRQATSQDEDSTREPQVREPRVGDLVDERLLRDTPTVSRKDVSESRRGLRAREPKVGDLVDAKLLENAPLVSGVRSLQ